MKPILASKNSTKWATTIDTRGITINYHALIIYFPRQKTEAIKTLLHDHWPASRHQEKEMNILGMAGKLRNLAHVVRLVVFSYGDYCSSSACATCMTTENNINALCVPVARSMRAFHLGSGPYTTSFCVQGSSYAPRVSRRLSDCPNTATCRT